MSTLLTESLELMFCPTGPGGGVDPHCSPGGASSSPNKDELTKSINAHDWALKQLYQQHAALQVKLKEYRANSPTGKASSALKKERLTLNKQIEAKEKLLQELKAKLGGTYTPPSPPPVVLQPKPEVVVTSPKELTGTASASPPKFQSYGEAQKWLRQNDTLDLAKGGKVSPARLVELGQATAENMHSMRSRFELIDNVSQTKSEGQPVYNTRMYYSGYLISDVKKDVTGGTGKGTVATYWSGTNDIRMMSNLTLRPDGGGLRLGHHNVGSLEAMSVFRHEYGHRIWYQNLTQQQRDGFRELYQKYSGGYKQKKYLYQSEGAKAVSQYAMTNAREFWAESFAAYTHPRYHEINDEKKLPPVIEAYMKHVLRERVAVINPDDVELAFGVTLAFCPTGPGGGVDPSCSPGKSDGSKGPSKSGGEIKTLKSNIGGSTGAKLVERDGQQYIQKAYHGNVDQAKNEVAANKIYNLLGVKAPASELANNTMLAEHIPNAKELAELQTQPKLFAEQAIRQGFAADALLANWDVIGLERDNIIVKDNVPYRIDNGGALEYRAQGGLKGDQFGTTVKEIDSLRDPHVNAQSAAVFGKLTDTQISQQVADLSARFDPEKIHEAFKSSGYTEDKAKELTEKLSARMEDLRQRFLPSSKEENPKVSGDHIAQLQQKADAVKAKASIERAAGGVTAATKRERAEVNKQLALAKAGVPEKPAPTPTPKSELFAKPAPGEFTKTEVDISGKSEAKPGEKAYIYSVNSGESLPKELTSQFKKGEGYRFIYDTKGDTWHVSSGDTWVVDHGDFLHVNEKAGQPDLTQVRGIYNHDDRQVLLYDLASQAESIAGYSGLGKEPKVSEKTAEHIVTANLKQAQSKLFKVNGKKPKVEIEDIDTFLMAFGVELSFCPGEYRNPHCSGDVSAMPTHGTEVLKVHTSVGSQEIRMHYSPTKEQLQNLLAKNYWGMRGLIGPKGDSVYWNANAAALHIDVAKTLDTKNYTRIEVAQKGKPGGEYSLRSAGLHIGWQQDKGNFDQVWKGLQELRRGKPVKLDFGVELSYCATGPGGGKDPTCSIKMRTAGDGSKVARVERPDGSVLAVHSGKQAYVEKVLKERYPNALVQHVKSFEQDPRTEVLSHNDGKEHLVLTDHAGVVLGRSAGEEESVNNPAHLVSRLQDPNENLVNHHSHPFDSPPSMSDVLQLANNPGLREVNAHSQEASYKIRVPEGADRRELYFATKNAYGDAHTKVLDRVIAGEKVSREESYKQTASAALQALTEKKLLEYTVTPSNGLSLSDGPHEYGCLLAILPENIASDIAYLQGKIDPTDLVELELEPHVTVRYGFDQQVTAEDFVPLLADSSPIKLTLLKPALFQNDTDVLKLDVFSQCLGMLNQATKDAGIPASGDTHPIYKPHVTIAYLKAGTGWKYLGLADQFEGTDVVLREVVYSAPDGSREVIELNGDQSMSIAGVSLIKEIQFGVTLAYEKVKAGAKLLYNKFKLAAPLDIREAGDNLELPLGDVQDHLDIPSGTTSDDVESAIQDALDHVTSRGMKEKAGAAYVESVLEKKGIDVNNQGYINTLVNDHNSISHAAAERKRTLDDEDVWGYEYEANTDRHEEMDGVIAAKDDEVWDEWFPPNGNNCQCKVRVITFAEAREEGLLDEEDEETDELLGHEEPDDLGSPEEGFDTDWQDLVSEEASDDASSGELDSTELSLSITLPFGVELSFCPTGPGGGVDPHCSPHEAAMNTARQEVLAHGEATGHELSILINKDGDRLGSATSETVAGGMSIAEQVMLTPEQESLLKDPTNEITITHNHPQGTSLSSGDIAVLGKYPGLKVIEAVTKEGWVYRAARGPNYPDSAKKALSTYDRAHKSEREILLKRRDRGEISHEEVNARVHHNTNVRLAEKKIIQYAGRLNGKRELRLAFCPTGPGGGVDPHCSPGGSGATPRVEGSSGLIQGQSHIDHLKSVLASKIEARNHAVAMIKQIKATGTTKGLSQWKKVRLTANKDIKELQAKLSQAYQGKSYTPSPKPYTPPTPAPKPEAKSEQDQSPLGWVTNNGDPVPGSGVQAGSHSEFKDKYEAWAGQQLTPGEKTAIRGYTGSEYSSINSGFRNNVFPAAMLNKIHNIDAGLAKAPLVDKDTIMYRKIPGGGETFRKLKAGDIFIERGYASCSIDKNKWSGSVVLNLKVPAGAKGAYVDIISANKGEREFLMPRDTTMHILRTREVEVKSTYGNSHKMRYIDAEVVIHGRKLQQPLH